METQYSTEKDTRLESSRRTVPARGHFRFRPLLGKHRQGHPTNFHSLGGPLKSGKQTALPTFQPPLLLECHKSIQTDFVAFGVCTRPPVVRGRDEANPRLGLLHCVEFAPTRL